MERNQMETNKRLEDNNKRLDDVMKSNIKLQQMLLSVLGNVSGKESMEDGNFESSPLQIRRETSDSGGRNMSNVDAASVGKDKSELWWDNLCQKSGDEDIAVLEGEGLLSSPSKRSSHVSFNARSN